MSSTDVRTDGPGTLPPPPPPPPGAGGARHSSGSGGGRSSVGDIVRLVLRGVGQLLVTAGLVILLFVVYEVWVTNIFADQKQATARSQFDNSTTDPLANDNPLLTLPGGPKQSAIPVGTGIANIYVPRFGRDYHYTIVEGVTDASLEKGPGHYIGTAYPGQVGDFAVAGHRVGKGEPFLNLDQLKPGDDVVIQTKAVWVIYTVLGQPGNMAAVDAHGVPGTQTVDPSDGDVVDAVPNHPGEQAPPNLPAGAARDSWSYMTMTTCTPKFSASQRLIVHASLKRIVKVQGSALPRELAGGTI